MGVDVQDPMVRQATMLRQLAAKYDTSTPEGLKQYAAAVGQFNPMMAQQIAKSAADLEEKIAGTKLKTAQTFEAGAKGQEVFDKRAALNSRTDMLIEAGLKPSEAQGIASNDTAFAKYVENKNIPTPAEYAVQAGKLGFGVKPRLSDYTPDQVNAMEKGVFTHKAGIAAAGAASTRIVNPPQETAFSKELGSEQAKQLVAQQNQAGVSAQALDRLQTMEKTTGNVYSGPTANTAIAASQLLSSVGLLSDAQAKTLSNSEVYNKSAKDLVMKDLGGKLGAGISNADRSYIEERIPQLQNSPAARMELIQKLKEIHLKEIEKAQAMQAHANKFQNLNTFDFAKYGMTPSAASPSGQWSIKPVKP
jgi:hypothetical protein